MTARLYLLSLFTRPVTYQMPLFLCCTYMLIDDNQRDWGQKYKKYHKNTHYFYYIYLLGIQIHLYPNWMCKMSHNFHEDGSMKNFKIWYLIFLTEIMSNNVRCKLLQKKKQELIPLRCYRGHKRRKKTFKIFKVKFNNKMKRVVMRPFCLGNIRWKLNILTH